MKIYKCHKNILKWKEIPQIHFKWNLPILVNTHNEVVAGNCLKESLSDTIYVIVIDQTEKVEQHLFDIELKIVEENSFKRFNLIYSQIQDYFRELKKPVSEQLTLFEEVKERNIITEDNYQRPCSDITYSHGKKNNKEDFQLYLFEEFKEVIKKKEEINIEIDMEIMKEIM